MITEKIAAVRLAFDQQQQIDLKHIESLQNQINEHKRTASLWQKLLSWFRKMPQEIELKTARQQVQDTVDSHECAIRKLLDEQGESRTLMFIDQISAETQYVSDLSVAVDQKPV